MKAEATKIYPQQTQHLKKMYKVVEDNVEIYTCGFNNEDI